MPACSSTAATFRIPSVMKTRSSSKKIEGGVIKQIRLIITSSHTRPENTPPCVRMYGTSASGHVPRQRQLPVPHVHGCSVGPDPPDRLNPAYRTPHVADPR